MGGQRTIVITGASDGIGAAVARKLAAKGDRLLPVGRRADKLDAVAGLWAPSRSRRTSSGSRTFELSRSGFGERPTGSTCS